MNDTRFRRLVAVWLVILWMTIGCGPVKPPDPPPPPPPVHPSAPFHLTVSDVTGAKVADARVDISVIDGEDDGHTSAEGYWARVLPLIAPHESYRIEVHKDGYHSEGADVPHTGETSVEIILRPQAPPLPPVTPRRGVVRLENGTFIDADGVWWADAVTLMPAIALVNDYPGLAEENCKLSRYGIDAIRLLANVGGQAYPGNGGSFDPWGRLVSNPLSSAFPERLAKTIDYFYDTCGMRSGITIFGGITYTPSESDQAQAVRRVIDVVLPRLHKVGWIEVANEMWQNGFAGDEGIGRARGHARALRAALPPNFPIAISTARATPEDMDPTDEMRRMFEGSAATLYTPHFSRATNKIDGPWRPVRQPWEWGAVWSLRGAIDNEPIGPGSSVVSERDASRLVAAWITTKIAGLTGRVFHTDAGVWASLIHPAFLGGHSDGLRGAFALIVDEPGARVALESQAKLKAILPPDMHTWKRTRHGFAEHPFADSFVRSGDHFSQIWVDGITSHGVVRAYATLRDERFVVLLSGIRDRIDLRWSRALEADVYSTKTGEWVGRMEAHERSQTWRQSVDTDLVIVGRFR